MSARAVFRAVFLFALVAPLFIAETCAGSNVCTAIKDCKTCTSQPVSATPCYWCKGSNLCTDISGLDSCTDWAQLPAFCPAPSNSGSASGSSSGDNNNNNNSGDNLGPSKEKKSKIAAIVLVFMAVAVVAVAAFVVRLKQVAKLAGIHEAAKTGAVDFMDLDAHTQGRLQRLVHAPDGMVWGDAAMPVPSIGALVFAVVLGLFIMIFATVVFVFSPAPLVVAFLPHVGVALYAILIIVKVIRNEHKTSGVYALSNQGAYSSETSLFGGESHKVWQYYQIRPSDIQVQTSCLPTGTATLVFAYEMQDVTDETRNRRGGHARGGHPDQAIHVSKYANLDQVMDHVAEGADVRQGGRTFRKVALGFNNIVRAHDVESMLRERVTAAHLAMQQQMQPPPVMGYGYPLQPTAPVYGAPYPPPHNANEMFVFN